MQFSKFRETEGHFTMFHPPLEDHRADPLRGFIILWRGGACPGSEVNFGYTLQLATAARLRKLIYNCQRLIARHTGSGSQVMLPSPSGLRLLLCRLYVPSRKLI